LVKSKEIQSEKGRSELDIAERGLIPNVKKGKPFCPTCTLYPDGALGGKGTYKNNKINKKERGGAG